MSAAPVPIRRALISVFDKSGVVELAQALAARGVEILSTGGTAAHLTAAGLAVTPVARWSGAPEILGGRVKTLTPKVFGAILHDRDNPSHLADCEAQQIPPIDLVVVNLYPFEATIAREGVTVAEAIEQIDVGGPSMLRAAAKNFRHVLPLCHPSLYPLFIEELESGGGISEAFRLRAAVEVFRKTAAYDAAIARFLSGDEGPELLPERIDLTLGRVQGLRYGENPQQQAGFYAASGRSPFEQLQGKELSYNNLLDLDAAFAIPHSFEGPTCAVIKHTNPCGAATAGSIEEALGLALESDPVSAFGGIIGTNREFTEAAALLVGSMFLEVIVAPSFDEGARHILSAKKNLRLVVAKDLSATVQFRSAAGGMLVQSSDRIAGRDAWRVVTKKQTSPADVEALDFVWRLAAHVKSNAIVLGRGQQSVGIGAGQMSRVDAARIAIMKAVLPTSGSVCASDAFFPFRDGLDLLCDAGVAAVIQPGGSVRDDEVIAAADERDIAMVFTGERHFKH
jgi:phosphoribosylaminoimidazolecarboxamide formyltransferase/IMP cyclohydrolase